MHAGVGFEDVADDAAVAASRSVVAVVPGIPVARWYMAVSLLVLNLLDVVTTKLILAAGGSEANPLMRPIVDHPYAAYALKLSLSFVIGCLLLKAPRSSRLADRAVFGTICAYVCVIGWNLVLVVTAVRTGRLL